MTGASLPGVTLDEREHVCVFHRGPEERDTFLAALVGDGLAEGDRCLCIADSPDPEAVAQRLDPQRHERPDQLTVLPATAYLPDGRFVPERIHAQWDSMIGGYVADGYRHVRGIGELSWFLRSHRSGDDAGPLLEYEAMCNTLVKRRPATIFCLYDLDLLDGGLLPGVLRHHSAALARGVLFRSPRPPHDEPATASDRPGGHPWRIDERPGAANEALLLANLLLAGAGTTDEIDGLLAGIRDAVLDAAPGAPDGPEAERFLAALDGLAAPARRSARLEAELAARKPGATPQDVGPEAAELAGALLDGHPLGAADHEQARSFGVDLDGPIRAVVVRPPLDRAELAAGGIRLAVRRPGETAVVVADGTGLDDLLAAIGHHSAAGDVGLADTTAAVGIGGAHAGPPGAARSYREARRAAVFAERLGRPVLRHDDLGLFSLLADNADPDAVADLVDEWLGPLLAHDEGRRQKLLPTLAAYLDAGAAQQATADALGVHVSTLKYRLGRIEAVTGRALSRPDIRFQLQVALAAHRTVSALERPGQAPLQDF
jgi:hypothetical protein